MSRVGINWRYVVNDVRLQVRNQIWFSRSFVNRDGFDPLLPKFDRCFVSHRTTPHN